MGSSTCSRGRSAHVVAAVALLASARPVRAASTPATDDAAIKAAAEAKLADGVGLLKVRNYGEALERFEHAYALVPSPLIFYDFALAYLGLGDDPRALESFDRFIAEAPAAPVDKRLKAARHRDELRPRVSVVLLEADVGAAELIVDGLGRGDVSFPRRLYLAPGPHQIVARARGATQTTPVTCVAGEILTLAVHLPAPPPAPTGPAARGAPTLAIAGAPAEEPRRPSEMVEAVHPSPPSTPRWARPWALSAAALGLVSIGVGISLGLAARSDGDQVTGESQNRSTFTPDLASSGMRDQRLEAVFLAIGAVAVGASVGLYVWARHRHRDRPAEAAP